RVCSQGDTVHYADEPKIFARSEGSYLYDGNDTPYLDLQMWYSAVNLGYGNKRIVDAVIAQLDKLPQIASQYLHREKIELAADLGSVPRVIRFTMPTNQKSLLAAKGATSMMAMILPISICKCGTRPSIWDTAISESSTPS